jgi:hypothetical protein
LQAVAASIFCCKVEMILGNDGGLYMQAPVFLRAGIVNQLCL